MSVEEYSADEDDLCEFIPDDFEPESADETPFQCPERPGYCVVESLVEEHLCDQHAESELDEEAAAFAESIGLGSSQILPIKANSDEKCEYIDLINGAPACRQPATHARVLEIESFLCPKHLEEYLAASVDQRDES